MKRLWSIPVETSENLEINMAPLVDMVFLLLVFFIVTSRLAEETAIAVQRPEAATATAAAGHSVLLAVHADGSVSHGEERYAPHRVRGLVSRLLASGDTRPVILATDRACAAGDLVRIIDECRLGGARDVQVAASRPEGMDPTSAPAPAAGRSPR
jgi:biopolymer transport protein ExbD